MKPDGLRLVVALDGVDGCGDAVSNCSQHLVIATVSEGFWAAVKNVLKGSPSVTLETGWCKCFAPGVEIGRTW